MKFNNDWDYSYQAPFYQYRPNYPDKLIEIIQTYADLKGQSGSVVDIGAGTGNLSLLLSHFMKEVVAVEPNDNMRSIGIERTTSLENISWIKADGTETTLEGARADLVTFGSSFNVLDHGLALKEAYRLLKNGGAFCCMWNHRDLDDEIQKTAEDIICEIVPDYDRGVRRQNQKSVIEESGLFKNLMYIEMDFRFEQNIDNYINAWKSVKNAYWDLTDAEGAKVFHKIEGEIRKRLPKNFSINYTSRAWVAKKI